MNQADVTGGQLRDNPSISTDLSDFRFARGLLAALLIAVGFSQWPGSPPRPFESWGDLVVLFIGLVVIVAFRPTERFRLEPVDIAAMAWLLLTAVASVATGNPREAAIALFLGLIYGLVRLILIRVPGAPGIRAFGDALIVSGCIHAVLGIAGWTMSYFWRINALATVPAGSHFPFIGTIGRASGTTYSPTMLVALLSPCWLMVFARLLAGRDSLRNKSAFVVMSVSLVLTFSKTLPALGVGAAIILVILRGRATSSNRALIPGIAATVAFIVVIGHVWIHRVGDPLEYWMRRDGLTSGHQLLAFGGWRVDDLQYLDTKRAAFVLGWRNPLFGVGPGSFIKSLEGLRREGIYPSTLPDWAPHSTYLGTFAELGSIGLAALTAFFATVVTALRRATSAAFDGQHPEDVAALAGAAAVAAIEAISTDVLHFRFYWAILAAVASAACVHRATQPSLP